MTDSRVLIVDDEPDMVENLTRILRRAGYRCLRATEPERGLALEMAVDERAEVLELERQWREAEEIAYIADGTLSTPADIEEKLRRLKDRGEDQPSG